MTPETSQPAINAPRVVLVLIASFIAVHVLRQYGGKDLGEQILLYFAFTTGRYHVFPELGGYQFPGGVAADAWTFVSHMFLHADWAHLGFNSLWMLVFGSLVARRVGAVRFLLLSFCAAAGGAAANLLLYSDRFALLVGASGAISGQMGAAVHLLFAGGGSLAALNRRDYSQVRAASLMEIARNRQALVFLAVWLGANLIFGISGFGAPGSAGRIAWEAHMGGFAVGLFMFFLFDVKRNR